MKKPDLPFRMWRHCFALAAVALVYYLAARLSLLMMFKETNASPVWLPSGLAMAVVLVMGNKMWPGVFVGAFAANIVGFLSSGNPLPVSLLMSGSIALGNTLEALAGVYLLLKFIDGRNPFRCMRHAFLFIICSALVAPLISASIGVLSIWGGNVIPGSAFLYVWWTWWTGDLTGALLILLWQLSSRFMTTARN